MALTRAQLLMGDSAQGFVLPGQVQAVKEGDGITILSDGTIEVDSQSVRGLMKLGQTAAYADSAYNKYWWPTGVTATEIGKQLTVTAIDGSGNATLSWSDADGIDWTARGQIIAAKGAGEANDTLVNIGSDRSFLMSNIADAGNLSGLAYSDVITSSMKVPAGTQVQRPTIALVPGEFRFNSSIAKLEVWNGAEWQAVASENPADGSFVLQIKPASGTQTDVAAIPSGTTAERITLPPPARGYLRYNSTNGTLEFWNGTSWLSVAASTSGSFVEQSVATTGTDSAIIPGGTTANRQTAPAPAAGYFRYNSSEAQMEYFDGTNWILIGGSSTGSFVDKTVPTAPGTATPNAVIPAGSTANRQTAPVVVAGEFRYNTTIGNLEVYNGVAWVTVPSSTTGNFVAQTVPTTGSPSAVIPVGTTATRQTVPAPAQGYTRYNSTTVAMEVFDGTSWVSVGAPPTAGLGIDITGTVVKLKMPEAATPPTVGAAANQAIVGSMYYDVNLGVLFIYYSNGGSPVWVQIPIGGGGGGAAAATLAEAAAGTLNTVYNSPQTSVPKDSSGMTGAAIIPSGTAASTTAAGAGKLRYYSDTRSWFGNDGTSWIPFDQRKPVVTAASYTAKANDYVVVTAAGRTITLPAAPLDGNVVTVVVAGTFLDTVVARNGKNIMGLAQDITLDKQYAAMQFTYVASTTDWRLN